MSLFDCYCLAFVGLPYRWGGDDPMGGFDCSGLVIEILTALGAHPGLDMTAQGIHDWLLMHQAAMVPPRRGAVAFFGGGRERITHVALCVSGTAILEAGAGDRTTTTLAQAIAQNAYVRLRPLRRRSDLVAILLPQYPGGVVP